MSDLKEWLDQADEERFQRIIDEMEGVWVQAELGKTDGGPTDAELDQWQEKLDSLLEHNDVSSHKRVHWKHAAIVAAIIAAVLFVSVNGLYICNWVESIHEKYTQIQPINSQATGLEDWADAYIPVYIPKNYARSDTGSGVDFKYIEYTNTEGSRIYFYQYDFDLTLRIDTEQADYTLDREINGQSAYLFQKGSLSTIYWSCGEFTLSIEYDPEFVAESEILEMAKNLQWKEKKG